MEMPSDNAIAVNVEAGAVLPLKDGKMVREEFFYASRARHASRPSLPAMAESGREKGPESLIDLEPWSQTVSCETLNGGPASLEHLAQSHASA